MSVIGRIAQSVVGSPIGSPRAWYDEYLAFHAPLAHSLLLRKGYGPATFTRTTAATVEDFEGRLVDTQSGEARFAGARRVENLLRYSEDFSQSAWIKVGDTTVTGQNTINFPTEGSRIYQVYPSASVEVGRKYVCRVKLSGNGTVDIYVYGLSEGTQGKITISLTSTPKTYSFSFTAGVKEGKNVYISRNPGNTATQVTAYHYQLEDVTGQTNQNPSEYVSTDVLSAPYHGAGVDGVKYFTYQNGDTVDGNGVVTEAQGAAISSSTLKGVLIEGQRTNKLTIYNANPTDTTGLTLGGDAAATVSIVSDSTELGNAGLSSVCSSRNVIKLDNSGGAATAYTDIDGATGNTSAHSMSAYIRGGTGSISFDDGAGSTSFASSSGYVRRDSSNQTPADTLRKMRITADAGQTLYLILPQLEEGGLVSSAIVTEGVAVTRNADTLRYPSAGNIQDNSTVSVTASALTHDSAWHGVLSHNWALGFGFAHDSAKKYKVVIGDTHIVSTIDVDNSLNRTMVVRFEDASFWIDGAKVGAGNPPSLSLSLPLYIGSLAAASRWFGNIKNVKIWKKALSDAQLVKETS